MVTTRDPLTAGAVNFDETPIVQAVIEGVEYRIDTGFGSAVAISSRAEGTWDWTVLAEGKWDGLRLRSKPIDRSVTAILEQALAAAGTD